MEKNLKELCKNLADCDANEAQTRHEIIDAILHDILAWPRALTKVEEYIAPGFSDYILTKPNGDFFSSSKPKELASSSHAFPALSAGPILVH